jgi:hypothetical protein
MQVLQVQVSPLKGKISNKTKTKKDDKIGDIMEWWNNFTNWLSGDDDYSESAFSDTDEDFEDFYNEVTNNSDYSNNLYTDDSYDPNEIFSDYGEEDYLASEEGPFA